MRNFLFIAGLSILSFSLSAQDGENKLAVNGYITSMQTVMFAEADEDWIIDNLLHNRLNFHWYPSENFTGSLQLRNRLLFGESVSGNPDYADIIGGSQGSRLINDKSKRLS